MYFENVVFERWSGPYRCSEQSNIYRDHRRSNVFILHYRGIVVKTFDKFRCIIIDVFDLNEYKSITAATCGSTTAGSVVHRRYVESVRDLELV